MSNPGPLLMIPGPIELSPAVREAAAGPPPGHLAPRLIEAFGASLARMREVWLADETSQPFVVTGGGTLAMEMAVANLVEPDDRVVVVNTGFFSDRLSEMLRRLGAAVREIHAEPGHAPDEDTLRTVIRTEARGGALQAVFATHVDTSTGVRIDPEPIARIALEYGALSVFDGVCATAAERFEMARLGADLYLTASQKAIGLPPGLALLVASTRAIAKRASRRAVAPPIYLDWESWRPVMQAYEERRPSYFSTPATGLILALEIGLSEIVSDGMEARFAMHERAARAMRTAWHVLGLRPLPAREALAANTLSALRYPAGVDAGLVGRTAAHGVVVAGGLHPQLRDAYFRVGHMGYAATRPEMLLRTVAAIGAALVDSGAAVDTDAAVNAATAALQDNVRRD